MTLINTTPTVPTLTKEQLMGRSRTKIIASLHQGYTALAQTLDICKSLVWANPDLKPQEVVDAVGPDALDLFKVSSLAAQIKAIATGTEVEAVMPPGWEFNPRSDGGVDLIEPKIDASL